MIRSPALNATSIFGHKLSTAAKSVLARQFPNRIQMSLAFAEGTIRQVKKILVLADQNKITLAGVLPDFGIGGISQINIEHMLTVHATGCQKAGEGCRWLVIDQKLHETCRTV